MHLAAASLSTTAFVTGRVLPFVSPFGGVLWGWFLFGLVVGLVLVGFLPFLRALPA